MDFILSVLVWLNVVASALAGILLALVAFMPGWLSATLVATLTGIVMLVAFKYTSKQDAIKAVRSDIKAQLLSLKLFKDNTAVVFRAQGRLFAAAFWLLVYALVPMLVMMVPITLIITQLSLWYQARPLKVDEVAVVTLSLNGDRDTSWPEVRLEPTKAIEITTGPVRAIDSRYVCWNIKASEPGHHQLVFLVGGDKVEKELAIGDGFMRVSIQRPGWTFMEVLENPWEQPFTSNSAVKSIEIAYPDRSTSSWLEWTSGTNSWVIYWFIASMVAALLFRKMLGVNI